MIEMLQVAVKIAEIVIAIVVAGIPLALAGLAWFKGDLLNWVHVGIYDVEKTDGDSDELVIRTLKNIHLRELLMSNPLAGLKVVRAARRARKQSSPVLEFSIADGWKIRNLCRGLASSLCSDVWIAKALNVPTATGWFVLTLTRERTKQGDSRIGLTLMPESVINDQSSFERIFETDTEEDKGRLNYVRAIQYDWLDRRPKERELFKFLRVQMGVVKPSMK